LASVAKGLRARVSHAWETRARPDATTRRRQNLGREPYPDRSLFALGARGLRRAHAREDRRGAEARRRVRAARRSASKSRSLMTDSPGVAYTLPPSARSSSQGFSPPRRPRNGSPSRAAPHALRARRVSFNVDALLLFMLSRPIDEDHHYALQPRV